MKKLFMMAAAVAMLASCGSKAEKEDATPSKPVAVPEGSVRIAYVEVDSLMSNYQFCKDYSTIMATEYANIQNELASKQRTLEQHAAAMQQKYENNGFTTKQELESAQNGIAREQQDLAMLSDRLSSEFANRQAEYNEAMRDSIQAYLKEYNKKQKFDFILSKGGDNMLYANPAFDITEDVINGLNKRYKVKPEIAEKLKEAKKAEAKK